MENRRDSVKSPIITFYVERFIYSLLLKSHVINTTWVPFMASAPIILIWFCHMEAKSWVVHLFSLIIVILNTSIIWLPLLFPRFRIYSQRLKSIRLFNNVRHWSQYFISEQGTIQGAHFLKSVIDLFVLIKLSKLLCSF